MTLNALPVSLRDFSDAAMLEKRPLLHELFERRAGINPDHVALRNGDTEVSYEELNARANQLARFLMARGLGHSDPVAIWLEPGCERVVALLAILKIGAVACPMHVSLPPKVLAAIVDKVAAGALLTSGSLLERVQNAGVTFRECLVVDMLDSQDLITEYAENDIEWRAVWTGLAYIVHTSGSTGLPRAVAMSHRAFSHEIRWQIQQSSAKRAPTTLQFSSLGFDLFLTEVMSTLCEGGTLVMATEQVRSSSASLFDIIQKCRVERLLISRVVLQGLAEEVIRRDQSPTSLTEIMCTGEQLTISAEMRRFFKRHSCRFYNEYGMSEAPVVSAHVLEGDPDNWPDLPPVGTFPAGSRVYILDGDLRRVAPGEQGEVYVAGEFLAEGYLGADADASAAFSANPFGTTGLMFRSGDIGSLGADGKLTLVGRRDGVVNIRGIRIGLGEIEAQLRNHALVAEAVVLKVEDDKDARLAAYVKLKERNAAFASVLREWLAENVPGYSIPAVFIEVAEFPKTHSGKIDRRALPAPGSDRPQIATAYAAAANPLEARLIEIWKKVLRVASIGVKDKILDLGGTSLTIQELSREISRQLNVKLGAMDLFKYPSVAALAAYIAAKFVHLSDAEAAATAGDSGADEYLERRSRRKARTSFTREARGELES